jgi:hypothetical protein
MQISLQDGLAAGGILCVGSLAQPHIFQDLLYELRLGHLDSAVCQYLKVDAQVILDIAHQIKV